MILIDENKYVIAIADLIEVVDEQGEIGLIKVHQGDGFFYYGTDNRHLYEIIDAEINIETELRIKYIDGQFVESE